MRNGMRRLARDCAVLMVIAAIPAALTWRRQVEHPGDSSGEQGPQAITVAHARELGSRVLWVDARTEDQFVAGHVPGATPLELGAWNRQLPAVVRLWQPGRMIVVYCDAETCDASRQVAAKLSEELQLHDVFFLEGGWAAWNGGIQ